MENESRNNRFSGKIIIIFFVMCIAALILNEMEFFYVRKSLMRFAFFSYLTVAVIICFFAFHPKLSSKRQTKYVIISLTITITMILMTTLNFHAVLLLLLPMMVGINYRSEKIAIISFLGVLFCALLAPVFAIIFNTLDYRFFITLIYAIDEKIVDTAILTGRDSLAVNIHEMTPISIMFDFVAIPHAFFALVIGALIFASYRRKSGQYATQLGIVRESRDQILLGMADLVENRDLNTGGHIGRTSKVMEVLVNNLKKNSAYKEILTKEYCEYIIKTAPLHDLGKIAIPDIILNKPGRLTEEEFEKFIKAHPQKSYDIVEKLLGGLYEKKLLEVAKNVALYHHEKYDGSGYPKGLSGEEIPLEARLMAIADVYDALVSERCYKEAISHEEAYGIIRASIGKHFDPQLWDCFEKSFPKIVALYSKNTI